MKNKSSLFRATWHTHCRWQMAFVALLLGISPLWAQTGAANTAAVTSPTEASADSLRVVSLLQKGLREAKEPLHLWYARQFVGTPYVAQTLEVNPAEQLVVNLHGLDCTTFVETALALALTHRQGSTSFEDYKANLTRIRYRDGVLDGYPSRNHYFSQWIDSNQRQGIVSECALPAAISKPQTLSLHYMSVHPQLYPMLCNDTVAQQAIRRYELEYEGREVRYIPREQLNGLRSGPLGFIQNGDILAIVTNRDGLDTSHITMAVWGRDNRLHILHAGKARKQVMQETQTLYQYMSKNPSQIGIRVIRIKSEE